jgi:Uma2 family endonuclease
MPPIPLPAVRIHYEKAADKYLRSLTLEDHMESVEQAMQRKITLESMDLVHARRPDVQVFNELLVQYPLDEDNDKLGQVVPDNMVVIWPAPIRVSGSFNTPLQPTGPFWVLEYVSKNSERKDYEDNIQKYEQDLKVPYYLTFYPENQEMTLYKLQKGKYFSVTPDEQGRYALPELDLEIGLLDGWVRFWYQAELLALPGELLHKLDTVQKELAKERSARQAAEAKSEAERSARQAAESRSEEERTRRLAVEEELVRMRAEIERMRSQAKE